MKPYPFYRLGFLVLLFCHTHHGSAAEVQDERVTVNATTTDVKGLSPKEIQEAQKMAELFQLQKQLVYKLLQNFGVTANSLSPKVKAAIDQPQTTSLDAFYAFSHCLDLVDQKLYQQARQQCDKAVEYDPNFALARQLLASLPMQQQTMQEIVEEHMDKGMTATTLQPSTSLSNVAAPSSSNLVTPDLNNTSGACGTQKGSLGCVTQELDQSVPACDDNGHCGFYTTFLAQRSPGNPVTVVSSPYMNRISISTPPTNASGNVTINQVGQEGRGSLDLQLNPSEQTALITGFQDGQLNQGSRSIPDGRLERIVTHEFTGLELGAYLSGFDFNGRLGSVGNNNQTYDLAHGLLYFAEGQATPIDTVKNLGRVQYSGIVNGDFSVNGELVPCQGDCGHFTSTLNYGAAKLEGFNLEANAQSYGGDVIRENASPINQAVAAQITASQVDLRPNGAFQFDQDTQGSSFRMGANLQSLKPAEGVVAGQPFGSNAETLGGGFVIHGGNIQGAGNFGGGGAR